MSHLRILRLWGALLLTGALATAPVCANGLSKEERRERALEAARVKDYPLRPWSEALTYQNEACRVVTNTDKDTARYIAQLMRFAQKKYRRIFHYDKEIPRIEVRAYRTQEEYVDAMRSLGALGMQLAHTSGMFVQQDGERTIHVAYTDLHGPTAPTTVLLHEGTHLLVSLCVDFQLPEKDRRLFRGKPRTLSSVPLWLNEGLATFMEVSYYDGEDLVIGEINRSRLLQLQHEMEHDRHVTLQELLQTPQSEFGTSHYASAWGLVYWFLYDKDEEKEDGKRAILVDYFDECRKGFMDAPEWQFRKHFGETGPLFHVAWEKHIREEGYRAFLRLTIGEDPPEERWEGWENTWREYILDLDPNDPRGGLDD